MYVDFIHYSGALAKVNFKISSPLHQSVIATTNVSFDGKKKEKKKKKKKDQDPIIIYTYTINN